VAERADRVVKMRDGQVMSDSGTDLVSVPDPAAPGSPAGHFFWNSLRMLRTFSCTAIGSFARSWLVPSNQPDGSE
jgi:hypothetical protein